MKIVNICTYDNGGAGRAAIRINESLRTVGEESVLLVRNKKTQYPFAIEYCNDNLKRFIAKCKGFLNERVSYRDIMYERFGFDISRHPQIKDADVLILHWTNHFISYRGLRRLIGLHKPIIWVMHDMWLLTGGCHYDRYCGRYKIGCGECPQIPPNHRKQDITKENYELKKKLIKYADINIVTPCNWLKRQTEKSAILATCPKRVIHNPIDTRLYHIKCNKVQLREKYHFDPSSKIIVYGAYRALSDSKKGFNYLAEAMRWLPENYLLVIYGNGEGEESMCPSENVIMLGMIKEDKVIAEIMNIADAFVAPSEQENYSNSVLEALACGTPVAAFSIGGMPDLIEHKRNGYLCEYQNCQELAQGIRYCIEHTEEMGQYAVQKVERENSYQVIGSEYQQLCEDLVEMRR